MTIILSEGAVEARPPSYGEYWPVAAERWSGLLPLPALLDEIKIVARKLVNLRPRYEPIAAATGVPWYVIAVLHERESGANFNRQLAQGEPLNRRSTELPHAGPFKDFTDSARWALAHDHLNKVIDWRIEKILYYCEAWNGWGYWMYHPGIPSPYVYGATTVQKAGKYTADRRWSPTTWDTQLGCAALLLQMSKMDPTIAFVRETHSTAVPPPTPNARRPVPLPAAQVSWFQRLLKWLET